MELKKKAIIDVYRKLLDPMGFTVLPKLPVKTLKECEWKPPTDAEKYEELDSDEISKGIGKLKTQKELMEKQVREITEKTIDFMNKEGPDEITKELFTGIYAKDSILKSSVKVSSEKLGEVSRLVEYLIKLKQKKVKDALLKKFQKENDSIISMEVFKGIGAPIELRIVMK